MFSKTKITYSFFLPNSTGTLMLSGAEVKGVSQLCCDMMMLVS